MNLEIDNYCFACGPGNPIGLKLWFRPTEQGVTANFTPLPEHQGYIDIVHGGIISTLLDEAMAHAIISKNLRAVTVRMQVNFKKPTVIGKPLDLKGEVVLEKGKLIKAKAEIQQAGNVTAIGEADFLIVKTTSNR